MPECKQKSPILQSNYVQEGVKNEDGFGSKFYPEIWRLVPRASLLNNFTAMGEWKLTKWNTSFTETMKSSYSLSCKF